MPDWPEANREELRRLKAQRREEYLQCILVDGKFGKGNNGYIPNHIRAKREDAAYAWINSIFLVMNLLILLGLFSVLREFNSLLQPVERWACYPIVHDTGIGRQCTDFLSRL